MAFATAVALALVWVVALRMGATAETCGWAVALLGIGSVLTFLPAILSVDREHWGVTVLFCGAGRGMAALGAAYLYAEQHPGVPTRALYMSIASGAILVLIVETVVTIKILSKIERQREAMKASSVATLQTTPSDRA